jgi:hypothetical protein
MLSRVIALAPFIFRYNSGLLLALLNALLFLNVQQGAGGFPIRKGSFVIVEELKNYIGEILVLAARLEVL